jgi:hypothetical protein
VVRFTELIVKRKMKNNLPEKPETNIGEHLVNIFKAAAATAPFCGGIASLMSDYIPSARFKRLESFAKQLAEDIKNLEGKLDENYIKTDEFAFIFERCFRGAAENYQKEKLDAFRGILLNSAIRKDASEDEKEYFINLVNSLSALHIRILNFISKPLEYISENNIPRDKIQGGFSNFMPIAIPGVDLEVVKSAFQDLYQNGLINTDKSIFSTMTSSQGLQLLGNRGANLGNKFIEFCTLPRN